MKKACVGGIRPERNGSRRDENCYARSERKETHKRNTVTSSEGALREEGESQSEWGGRNDEKERGEGHLWGRLKSPKKKIFPQGNQKLKRKKFRREVGVPKKMLARRST